MVTLWLEHPCVGERPVELEGGLLVGREGGGADLELPWDPRVSRRHVRFWVDGDGVFFEDLASTNGTWLERERVAGRQALAPGQVVVVGETFFSRPVEAQVVEASAQPRASTPAPDRDLDAMMAAYLEGAEIELPKSAEASTVPGASPPPSAASRPLEPVLPPVVLPSPGEAKPRAVDEQLGRAHPRFTSQTHVGVRLSGREELKMFMTENISKGGLFVRTDSPPARGRTVEVSIDTPDGEVCLRAAVVHVVDAAQAAMMHQPAGVGLQFVDITASQREMISRYVDGVAQKLGQGPSTPAPAKAGAGAEATLQRAKELIGHAEAQDLYRAIGVGSKASHAEIQARIGDLRAQLAAGQTTATPPQIARLKAAEKVLDRVASVLTVVTRRLEYDFRRGDVRAEERLAEVKTRSGTSLADLRDAWMVAHADKAERARDLAKLAFEARKLHDFVGAVRHGKAALELDPFHEELRKTVAAWEDLVKGNP